MNDEKLLEEVFGERETSIDIALSYSRMSDFDRNGPKALIERNNLDDVTSVKIGSITDDLFNEDFDISSKYYLYDGNKPTATTGKVINIITENYNEIPDNAEILEIIKKNDYWKGSSDDVRLSKFEDNDEFFGYLKAFYESKNKIVVTKNDLMIAEDLIYTLKTHDHSRSLFESDEVRLNQVSFIITYNGIKLRGKLDFVFIDYKNKTVRFVDLKTGASPCMDFMKSFLKFRYYLQEAVYTKAFEQICKDLGLEGFTLLPFEFLYISRSEKIPLRWITSEKWHQAAIHGFVTDNGYEYNGLDTIIENIKWHWQNRVFDLPRVIYESKGQLILKDNYITINE